ASPTPRGCGRHITEGGGTHPSNEVCPARSLDQRGYGNLAIPRGHRRLSCPCTGQSQLEPFEDGAGRLAGCATWSSREGEQRGKRGSGRGFAGQVQWRIPRGPCGSSSRQG